MLACLACRGAGEHDRGDGSMHAASEGPSAARAWDGNASPAARRAQSIVSAALSSQGASRWLNELCTQYPSRLAGSAGYDGAADWALAAMQAIGLSNARLEPVDVPRWVRGDVERLEWLSEHGGPSQLVDCLALGGSAGTSTDGLLGELIAVTSLQELERLGDRARGKIVLFDRPFDASDPDPFRAYGGAVDQRSKGPAAAAKAGAVACLVRSMTPAADDVPHTGSIAAFPADVAAIPALAIGAQSALRLRETLTRGAKVNLRITLSAQTLPSVRQHNVVGEWLGRERPTEIVLVGAHLDAWDVGQGAHDDAAGVAHALESVALLARLGLRPRRTIRVVLFANEEHGLSGAAAYREQHRFELKRHMLALESDRGGFSPRGFATDANPAALAQLSNLARVLAPAGIERVVTGHGGADIGLLADEGVITVGFVPDPQRYFDLHHTRLDTLDKVHPRELSLGAGAIAAFLYEVADLPQALPRNPPKL